MTFEINKFFNELPIRILGSHEEPAFYANEIAKLLQIKDTRGSLRNFNCKEIVQREDRERLGIITYRIYKNRTPGRDDHIILLTSRGVYRMILMSRTDVAEQFREWVWDVLDELRITGRYEIQQELQTLRTINESILKENGLLGHYINDLKVKKEQFKTLVDKFYIIEFKNDPRLIKQRHVPKKELPDDYASDIDYDVESDIEDSDDTIKTKRVAKLDTERHNRIDNLEVYYRSFPNEADRTSTYTYKITYDKDLIDNTAGTTRFEMFVRDQRAALKTLARELSLYRLDSRDDCYYFACDLDKIMAVVKGVVDELQG